MVAAVPAKISNHLIKRHGITGPQITRWAASTPDWAEQLKRAVRDTPRFVRIVDAMADDIRAFDA